MVPGGVLALLPTPPDRATRTVRHLRAGVLTAALLSAVEVLVALLPLRQRASRVWLAVAVPIVVG